MSIGIEHASSKLALHSVLLNLAVTLVKAILALFTGSAALLADAIHGFSDLIASLAVWLGIRISKMSSEDFPFGLYKVENFVELGTAFVILFAGYEILRRMVFTSWKRELFHVPGAVIALVILSSFVWLFARHEKRVASQLNSPALIADAEHWMVDIASNTIVLISLIGSVLGTSVIDRIAAIVIVGFILHSSWRLMRRSLRSLLDASVDYATLEKIRDVVVSFPGVRGIKAMAARSSGPCIFAHVEVVLNERDLRRAHGITEEMERAVKEAVPHVEKVFIHYEPEEKRHMLGAIPLDASQGEISAHFGSAPYILFFKVDLHTGEVGEREVIENPFRYLDKGKGVQLADLLARRGVERIFLKSEMQGKGPEFIFSSAGVEISMTQKRLIDELFEEMRQMRGGKDGSR